MSEVESESYLPEAEAALEGGKRVTMARFFDISILDGDGREVQPEVPVTVNISLDNTAVESIEASDHVIDNSDPVAVAMHFEEKDDSISVDVKETTETEEAVVFDADGFSVWGIVYTVDFYYGDYEWHIPGGTVQSLRALLPLLGVVAEDEAAGFVESISDVTFSDETLVKPVPVTEDTTAGAIIDSLGVEIEYSGGMSEEETARANAVSLTAPDWALVSLKPFFTEESLTIRLRNEETVVIEVTDEGEGYLTVNDYSRGYLQRGGLYDWETMNAYQALLGGDGNSNKYRITAVSRDDYFFSKWTVGYVSGGTPWDSGAYLTNEIGSGALTKSQLYTEKLVFTAVFYKALRGLDIADGCQGMGSFKVNGQTHTSYVFYDNTWRDSDGKTNKYGFEAIPNAGYEFVRWDYYSTHKDGNTGWECTGSFYDQTIKAGTFNVDRGESWFLKAVFQVKKNPYKFRVGTYGNGQINSKYLDPSHATNTNGSGYPDDLSFAEGVFADDDKTQTRFNFGFNGVPNEGYDFAFWVYREDGLYKGLSSITNSTLIPHDETEFNAYFVDHGKKAFLYQSANTEQGTIDNSYNNLAMGNSDGPTVTATPNDGFLFVGWYDHNDRLVSSEPTFNPATASESMILTAKFRPADAVRYTLSVNDPAYGDITKTSNGVPTTVLGNDGSSSQDTNNEGRVKNTLTATPASNDYVFVHWTLNGVELPYSGPTIGPAVEPAFYLSADDNLQAVFMPVTVKDATGNAVSDINISNSRKEELRRWLKSLQDKKTATADKTAEVYDYANRIYKIDFTTETALMDMSGQIDLAFLLDVSNSMLFPSKLVKTDRTMILTQATLQAAFPEGGKHYIISNPEGTSTVYAIFRDSDGIWYFVDASYDNDNQRDEKKLRIEWNTRYAEPTTTVPFAYPIYEAVGSKQRKDYLNQSLQDTINSLYSILANIKKAGGTTGDIHVAYNTFASNTYYQHDGATPPAYAVSQEFQSLRNNENLMIHISDTGGGTRQDLALQDATEHFSWNEPFKYAILISDGAPLVGSKGTFDNKTIDQVRDNVRTQAAKLKANGVTLFTIGLSTQNVTYGSNLLKDIASNNPHDKNQKLFFQAENADDLEDILLEILQTIMIKRTTSGTVTDLIDPAFYPVKSDGTPVTVGWYDMQGEPKDITGPDGTPCYHWTKEGDKWKITWYNQIFGTDDTKWTDSIYVKAKENFLGGNAMPTNVSASVQPQFVKNSDGTWTRYDEIETINLPTPYVNVDELALTQNSTEWTVYLGQEVAPVQQLKDLFNRIEVLKVVSGDTNEMITNRNQMLSGKNEAASKRFNLKDVVSLSDDDWVKLISDKTVKPRYGAYGHYRVGHVEIKLEKNVASGETGIAATYDNATKEITTDNHETTVVGSPVETYTLTVKYVPKTAEEREEDTSGAKLTDIEWHTTPSGTPGDATDSTNTSTNVHNINVFVRGLRIAKTDMDGHVITTDTAKFKLYRGLKGGEVETDVLTVGDSTVDVIQVGGEFETTNGVIVLAELPYSPNGLYYLVETKAPAGFIARTTPVVVRLSLENAYWNLNAQDSTATANPTAVTSPYNWRQTAAMTYDSSRNATEESVTVDGNAVQAFWIGIVNSNGVSLPSTGGPGTTIIYAAGIGMIVVAVLGLMLRRRKARDVIE